MSLETESLRREIWKLEARVDLLASQLKSARHDIDRLTLISDELRRQRDALLSEPSEAF